MQIFCKQPDCHLQIPNMDLPYINIETDGPTCLKCMSEPQKIEQCDHLLNISQYNSDISEEELMYAYGV